MNLNKLKKNITYENLLYLMILIAPILDIVGFLYRIKFPETILSPATIIRPLIPLILFLFIFFKEKKYRSKIFIVSLIYFTYSIIHLLNFILIKTTSSYGNLLHEMQYLINYSFMICTLFVFYYGYKNYKLDKLPKVSFVTLIIYLILIYTSIITNTSTSTYIEGIGFKGWFSSGNAIGSILLLLFCICLPYIQKNKKYILGSVTFLLLGLFLMSFLGTRTGLFGFILCLIVFLIANLFVKIINHIYVLKKQTIIIVFSIALIVIIPIIVLDSNTFERQKNLEDMSTWIKDSNTNEVSHVSKNILKIVNRINKKEYSEKEMTKAQQESMIDLYEFSNKHELKSTDRRLQQIVYHVNLIRNQGNLKFILFGNGFLTNMSEMTLESEFLSLFFNFGLIGGILYLGIFILIALKSIIYCIKNLKNINVAFLMYLFAILLSFALSFFAGYTFFNVSSMTIIVIINVLILKEMEGKNL